MKYIRGQDGCIYSVSKLTPPCEEHPEGEAVWKLRVVTVTGSIHVYATYSTEVRAIRAYTAICGFMYGDDTIMSFNLGLNGLPYLMDEAEERENDRDLIAAREALEKRADEIMEEHLAEFPMPECDGTSGVLTGRAAITPWWRKWWPRSRKEKAND